MTCIGTLKTYYFSESTAIPLFSWKNVLIWITPFLVFHGHVVVNKRKMLGATACLEWGGGSVFCCVYMPNPFIDIPGLAKY